MSGGFTIVTYVHPFLMGQTPPGGNNTGNAFTPSILPFLKGHLKALGTIQIMIGVVTFLFGIVLAVNWNIPISVISGIVYWGSLIYIITGSLSVAAEPKLHPCVVKGSLGMNVVSVVVSGTAIIILCIDCFLQLICEYCSTEENMETVRVIGVLAVLSLLQFFISICISAFACKATCCSEPMVPVVTIAHPAHINPQTVQIMIGLITLLFGIVLGSDFSFVLASVVTGNLYWASIVYIIAGSLSVAAETKLHPCLVRGSLGMNVVSAVFSAVGMGVLITDFFLYYDCYSNEVCYRFQARSKAISGVLLVFAVLQFIISISISVFACKATCCSETMVPFVTYANHTVTGNPQNVVYIPQAQVNMNNPVQQNIPVQQNNPVQQNIYDWPGR